MRMMHHALSCLPARAGTEANYNEVLRKLDATKIKLHQTYEELVEAEALLESQGWMYHSGDGWKLDYPADGYSAMETKQLLVVHKTVTEELNKRIKDANKLICCVCLNPFTPYRVIVPCGHGCCSACFTQLPTKHCPMCRTQADSLQVVY